jgi:hypothetical protein
LLASEHGPTPTVPQLLLGGLLAGAALPWWWRSEHRR